MSQMTNTEKETESDMSQVLTNKTLVTGLQVQEEIIIETTKTSQDMMIETGQDMMIETGQDTMIETSTRDQGEAGQETGQETGTTKATQNIEKIRGAGRETSTTEEILSTGKARELSITKCSICEFINNYEIGMKDGQQ